MPDQIDPAAPAPDAVAAYRADLIADGFPPQSIDAMLDGLAASRARIAHAASAPSVPFPVDGDHAGRIARQHAEAAIAHYAHVNALVPPDGLDTVGGDFDRAVDALTASITNRLIVLTARW